MGYYIITFRSVTPAQRGESVLRQTGFLCSLQRTPRWMEAQGCGYSIRINSDRIKDAIQVLQQRKIPFRKVYRTDEKGSAEEISL
ncbi:MAG: DUF3343 domain-containing protein [Oscillospiraceae bacterium]|nr:DUF3343 domain-containing protein [Oscillospiraceae bacterium]